MADERMTPEVVGPGNVIHHATVFGRAGALSPTTCGRTEVPKPATDVWASVKCDACLARRCAYLIGDKARCGGVSGTQHVHRAPVLTMDGYPSTTGGGA